MESIVVPMTGIFGKEAALAAAVKTALGLDLIAQNEGDPVNGHISTWKNDDGEFCEVVLYDADEPAGVGHASPFAKHGLTAAKKTALRALLAAHRP